MTISQPRGPAVPPVDMSPAEKLTAEREARHDVVARGHRTDPLVLQHYLTHARAEEVVRCSGTHASGRAGSTAAPRATAAPKDAATPALEDPTGERVPAGVRHAPWWRRFRGH